MPQIFSSNNQVAWARGMLDLDTMQAIYNTELLKFNEILVVKSINNLAE